MGNCTILDSACSSTICGKKWLNGYIESLGQSDLRKKNTANWKKENVRVCWRKLIEIRW